MSYFNKYEASPVASIGTVGITTTSAAIGSRVDVSKYKYMRVFLSATMTAVSKTISIGLWGSHTTSGTLYRTQLSATVDVITNNTYASLQDNVGIAAIAGGGFTFASASAGTVFTLTGSVIVNVSGYKEVQLYGIHNDTGTINTTIDYVLFNN